MKSSIITAIFLLIMCVPIAFGQSEESLFCSDCGKQSALTASFCFECGHRLDKTTLVSRLKGRLAKAGSLQQPVSFTRDEISVLVDAEVESRARELICSGMVVRTPRPKTQVEMTLDAVVPIVVGSAAAYFLGQMFYRTH